MERREIASRRNRFIQTLASRLAASAVTPNQISVASCVFAALAPLGLLCVGGFWGAILALAGVQLRLLSNVLDGLVAVEGGKGTAIGAIYNEFPDRIADSFVLIAFGYAVQLPALGWLAALLAALTAYIRVFGGALGFVQSFKGPMAKQHRMAVTSAALVVMALGALGLWPAQAILLAQALLWVVVIGSAWTCWRRTQGIAQQLVAR